MHVLIGRGGSGGQRRLSLFYVKGVVVVVVVVVWMYGGRGESLERGEIKIVSVKNQC